MVNFAGKDYVCSSLATANALGLGLDGGTATSKIFTYKQGYVHFLVWLNRNGVNDFSILRNQFVHLKVNGVLSQEFLFPGYPGDPSDPTKPIDPQDPTNPQNPDVIPPTDPVDGSQAWLQVEITVMPWTYKLNDAILQ